VKPIIANCEIIGIDIEGDISEGYDGGIDFDEWTAAERYEVAQFMIKQWRKFGDEEAMARAFYGALSSQLKEKIRPWYPEVDQWEEADAIELCLAFNRAVNEIRRAEHAY
jgi:hypothetical protein